MKFTTQFALHSQTTRLFEHVSQRSKTSVTDGIFTLYDTPFQGIYSEAAPENVSVDYNSRHEDPDFKIELFPLHSPLLRESLLVSFPPLINMLKFSG